MHAEIPIAMLRRSSSDMHSPCITGMPPQIHSEWADTRRSQPHHAATAADPANERTGADAVLERHLVDNITFVGPAMVKVGALVSFADCLDHNVATDLWSALSGCHECLETSLLWLFAAPGGTGAQVHFICLCCRNCLRTLVTRVPSQRCLTLWTPASGCAMCTALANPTRAR